MKLVYEVTQNHHCDCVPLSHSEQRNCMAPPIMGVLGSDSSALGLESDSGGMFDANGDSVIQNWRKTADNHQPQTTTVCQNLQGPKCIPHAPLFSFLFVL